MSMSLNQLYGFGKQNKPPESPVTPPPAQEKTLSPKELALNVLTDYSNAADQARVDIMKTDTRRIKNDSEARASLMKKIQQFEERFARPLHAINSVLHNHTRNLDLPQHFPHREIFIQFATRQIQFAPHEKGYSLMLEFGRLSDLLTDFHDWRKAHDLIDT